jgi:hypothetical protein
MNKSLFLSIVALDNPSFSDPTVTSPAEQGLWLYCSVTVYRHAMFSNCFLISEAKSEAQMPAASAAGKRGAKKTEGFSPLDSFWSLDRMTVNRHAGTDGLTSAIIVGNHLSLL